MKDSTAVRATVRWLTYLAPGVPAQLFEALASRAQRVCGHRVDLRYVTTRSGPHAGEHQPFTSGRTDLAFLCAPSYVWLTDALDPPVELLGVAWVPADPRADARPVYFSDLLAAAGGPRSLPELAGARVAYNDDVSLSGYHSLRLALEATGLDAGEVHLVRSGSHQRSLALLHAGAVDAVTVDSIVWTRFRRIFPRVAHRMGAIAALGPHPVQPVVVRADMPAATRQAMREALLGAAADPVVAPTLADAGLTGFATVDEADYALLRRDLGRQDGRSGATRPGSTGIGRGAAALSGRLG